MRLRKPGAYQSAGAAPVKLHRPEASAAEAGGPRPEGRVAVSRYQAGLSPAASPNRLVCREQHRSWCSLGFVRSIALTPHMCAALSSPPWIALLMKVVEGHAPFTAASLQRQVMWAWPFLLGATLGLGATRRCGIKIPALPLLKIRCLGSVVGAGKGGSQHRARVSDLKGQKGSSPVGFLEARGRVLDLRPMQL